MNHCVPAHTNSTGRPGTPRRRGAVVKWLVVALGVAGVGGAGWIVSDRIPSGDAVSKSDLFEVREMDFDILIPASGELEALQSIEIRSQVENQVVIKWIIDEGSSVNEGDLLVELASDEIRNRIEEEELRVESATSDLVAAQQSVELQKNENKSAEEKARLQVEIAQLELARWEKGEHQQKMKDLELAIETSSRNVERYTKDYEDSMRLFNEGFESESRVIEDEVRMKEAVNALAKAELAQTTYTEYEEPKLRKQKESDVEEAQAELERVMQRNSSQLAQKEADLIGKERSLRIREQRLDSFREQLEYCQIKAPSDGLVVYGTSVGGNRWRQEEPLQIGQQVYPNQLLIILPNISTIVANVKVHESQSNLIETGLPARVKIDAIPGLNLTGSIRNIGVLAEQGGWSQVREYSVRILIEGVNEWGLKPSMRCKADIVLGRVDNAVAVPLHAVFVDKGERFVWTPAGDGNFRRQPVKVGRASETMIEIVEGLKPGDRVLLRAPTAGEQA
ncbi:MAG: efflux RND transporter periplasmic adaptor subunit [Phycisphaerales bacterium]